MFGNRMKIFSIILFAALVVLAFCIRESGKLYELQEQKKSLSEQNSNHIKFAKKVSENNIVPPKSAEKIFCEKSNSKELIEKSIRKFSKDKILLKRNQKSNAFGELEEIEFKFISPNEKNIYEFLQYIYFEINGLLVLDQLSIDKQADGKYAVDVVCKVIRYAKKFEKYIRIKNLQSKLPIKNWLHIFKIDREKYTLDGIIKNSVAFINRESKKIGNEIGEYELIQIDEKSITLKRRNSQKNIQLGESW